MTTRKKKTIAERAAEGDYDLVIPLDFKILEEMPAFGTTLAGMYELGTTVGSIAKTYPMVSSGSIAARVRNLHAMGICHMVKLIGGPGGAGKTIAWQRTELGDRLLKEWKDKEAEHGNA